MRFNTFIPYLHVYEYCFFSLQASSTVDIHGGSGYYYLDNSDNLTDRHHYPIRLSEKLNKPFISTNTILYIMPRRTYELQPKHVGRVTIQAIDLCFPSTKLNPPNEYNLNPSQAEFNVDVIGLSVLNLRVHNQIQLGDEVGLILCFVCLVFISNFIKFN